MRAIFVRHGQSTGNIGIPNNDPSEIELTELGLQQAIDLAMRWKQPPDLIVTSPFLRARQTAEHTMRCFPSVSVEVWPVQEFTFLRRARWREASHAVRMAFIQGYWEEANPAYLDGEGAESFKMLLERAKKTLRRLEEIEIPSLVYIFSHNQFIQAVRSIVVDTQLSDRQRMRRFWHDGEPVVIPNACTVSLSFLNGEWSMSETGLACPIFSSSEELV